MQTETPESETPSNNVKSTVERRTFLKAGTGALIAAGLGPVVLFSGDPATAAGGDFTVDYFAAMTGESFHIDTGTWNQVKLVDAATDTPTYRVDQFTVTFQGASDLEIGEGTYEMAAPDGSTMHLHLNPAGSDGAGRYFQASFSILKPRSPSCGGGGY